MTQSCPQNTYTLMTSSLDAKYYLVVIIMLNNVDKILKTNLDASQNT